jgi:hypothetical protein
VLILCLLSFLLRGWLGRLGLCLRGRSRCWPGRLALGMVAIGVSSHVPCSDAWRLGVRGFGCLLRIRDWISGAVERVLIISLDGSAQGRMAREKLPSIGLLNVIGFLATAWPTLRLLSQRPCQSSVAWEL